MSKHEKYHYSTLEELTNTLDELGIELPLSEDVSVLSEEYNVGNKTINNRVAIQPMEGCDGTPDGAPDELTFRRYQRFAKSGAGLVWGEATAVVKEGRANPRQLFLTKDNIDGFKKLINDTKEICLKENGFEPYIVCQLTHSGRYSKPTGVPAPMIAYHNEVFEANNPISDNAIVSDEYLKSLSDHFGTSAELAKEAGFDAADIKCCHRYLLSELCSAYERDGLYGGSLENRTRLYFDAIRKAKTSEDKSFKITSRLNLYDGFEYPNGFGVKKDKGTEVFLDESIELVGKLTGDFGFDLIDFTIGNPYFNPHVNRPYDNGGYVPNEHPLEGVSRMMECIGTVKRKYPEICVVGSGFSYLRHLSPYLAAGMISRGLCDIAGFGREAFAYEGFAKDVMGGNMVPNKCCITCGKCTELMRAGTVAGCVVRDSGCYLPIYKKYCMKEDK